MAALGAAGITPSGWAQTVPDESPQAATPPSQLLPKISVTGSNIPRIDAETSTPTLIIRREEIQRTGVSTVKELVDSLTGSSQLAAGTSSRSLSDIKGAGSFAAGASSASLRHLGHQATLVLLNSRRLPSFAMDDDPGMFVNLDTLPLSAVERVEVLRSGASAIYGSDAVAGVINIITRRDFRGVELRASHEQSTVSKDFRARMASLTAGFGDPMADGYNVMLNAELYHRASVMWGEVLGQVNPQATRESPGFGTPSVYSSPGNVGELGSPGQTAMAGCPPAQLRNGLCYYDRYARLQAQPAAQRANFLVSGELRIDATLKGFAEAMYSSTETRYLLPDPVYDPSNLSTWFDPSTGKARYFRGRQLPAGHPLNPTGQDTDFQYRFTDANSGITAQSDSYRLLTGLRGSRRGYDWEAALGTMGDTVHNRVRGFFSDSGFKQVIGDYDSPAHDPAFFNRGYQIGQANSAAVLSTLFPGFSHTGRNSQTFLDGKVLGPAGQWRGKTVDIALGFNLRHERLSIRPSSNLATGDIVNYGSAQTEGRRTFGSVFGEANLPLADRLEVQAAARLDKYPGFGANLSPKLGMRFEATPWMLMRGTVEGGFRAPNLTENASSTRYAFESSVYDPKRCPAAEALYGAAAGLPDSDPAKAGKLAQATIALQQECVRGVATVRNANPNLQPERSTAATLGLVFQPARGHLASMDYWIIQRRNEIGYRSAQDLVNNEDNLAPGRVNRLGPGDADPSFKPGDASGVPGALTYTSTQMENTARTLTSGIDLGLQSRTPTPLGMLTGGLQATYLLNYMRFHPLTGGYGDNLAGRYGFPRLRAALTASLASGPFTNSFRLNFLSGTKLQADFDDAVYSDETCRSRGWSDCEVHRSSVLDYDFAYTGVRGLSLGVHVRNLLNRRPPVDLRAMEELGGGINPQDLADVQRRSLLLTVGYRF